MEVAPVDAEIIAGAVENLLVLRTGGKGTLREEVFVLR